MLSELRFALNYRADSFSPLMVILSGQPRLAGCDKQIFTDDAIGLIYQCSKAVPRRVNNICRYALIAAAQADSPTVDADAVQRGLDDDELI